MNKRIYLNNDWMFREYFGEDMMGATQPADLTPVRLPHTVRETPLHYFDEHEYQMISGYRRLLYVPEEWSGKTLLLTIGAAAHSSEVFVNGIKVGEHHCGYTAFTMDITQAVHVGKDNVIAVQVDSRETQNIPPFGFVIDYMTYGGIYRDVYLEIKQQTYLNDLYVSTKLADRFYDGEKEAWFCEKTALKIEADIEGISEDKENGFDSDCLALRLAIRRKGETEFEVLGDYPVTDRHISIDVKTGERQLWDIKNPALYEVRVQLVKYAAADKEQKDISEIVDETIAAVGYRKAVFKKDGFYLNGVKTKIRGLNRHQSYPYVGYAMPSSMQKQDADILKNELGLNAVRTSHYPQSHDFIDRCDELGLLVFTELPGWQHIGDEEWKEQAIQNVKDMVIQYRQHPSIVLWGVRINESVDDDEFYQRTNEAAGKLDPYRQTGGVRCYKKSHLLEDVYTYNDFVHSGGNKGCDKKADVTSDKNKGYMISEYMGHMYPTKAFDWEEHRVEHAIRHAKVLNDVSANDDIAGSFGWCMFDYNTHKDFGSGDRICYHGVMDMFRNPKLAASVYASQADPDGEAPVILELSSTMDIGEHPGCNRGETWIFTNADSVRMYKNDDLIREFTHDHSQFPDLRFPPIRIDDYIGDQLEKQEKMSHRQAEDVKAILNEVAKFGLYRMSAKTYMKAGKMMLMYHMKMDDAVSLYNKYIGDWGGKSTQYRFEAVKDGQVVKVLTKAPMQKVHLQIETDHTALQELHTYDAAAVRIRATDENGNVLPYYNEPVLLRAEGEIELIGPKVAALSGGMGGTYVRTLGRAGIGKLTIETVTGEKQQIEFTVGV